MSSLAAPLCAQQFSHIDSLFFTKGYGGADPVPQVLTVTSTGAPFNFHAATTTSSGGDWLAVSPKGDCCTTPNLVKVIVNASSSLPVGNYFGQVAFTGGGKSLIVSVTLAVTPADGPVLDRTPGELSFSMEPGGQPASQVVRIGNGGGGTLNWEIKKSTFNGADFLSASAQAGTGPAEITLAVLPENLPNRGATAGVYTGQLLILADGNIVTIPVSVSVGDAGPDQRSSLRDAKAFTDTGSVATAGVVNIYPANTMNVVCGRFIDINTAFGGFTLAPDNTTDSGRLITEANPNSGPVNHTEYRSQDVGAGTWTVSFHFKPTNPVTVSWVYIQATVNGGAIQRAWFNIVNGTVGTVPSGWTAQITPALNGWYRCSVTFATPANGGAGGTGFGLAPADNQSSYVGSYSKGVYEWGQQFESGALSGYSPNVGPCMDFSKSANAGTVAAGSRMGYTVALRNRASALTGAATAAAIRDPLPAGTGVDWSLSPYAGPGSCAVTGVPGNQALACDLGDLVGGAAAIVSVTSGTSLSSCGVYPNTATATSTNVGSLQAGATTTVQCPTASLSISKTHAAYFMQGQTGATYTVRVSNATGVGPTSGTVTVTDTIPAGLTLVSMAGSGWACPGTAANNCTRSDALAPGLSYPPITVTVNVAANAPSSLINQVGVSGGGSAVATSNDLANVYPPPIALRFVPVTPCRIADTRLVTGPFGGPSVAGGTIRDFAVPSSACGVPANAQAYALNVAVVPAGPLGYLTIWPSGQTQPVASTLNSLDGRIKSNASIVRAGAAGAISVFASNTTHVVLDINGYFVLAADTTALAFYPMTPCRVADTRMALGLLGAPAMGGQESRTFPILSSSCNIPATARAYSLSLAAVPAGPLGYLTTWPTGQARPQAASLNAITGTVTANAAIVPAGTNGSIDVFASNPTDVVIDINGYFAPMNTGGLSLYGVTPCRVVDTRQPAGSPAITSLDVAVGASPCGTPANARAHVLSVTVVPPAPLGFLTLWPQGQTRPTVSTLNALDGAVTSNLAIVPATNGVISVFASNPTHLIVDIAGYFGQ